MVTHSLFEQISRTVSEHRPRGQQLRLSPTALDDLRKELKVPKTSMPEKLLGLSLVVDPTLHSNDWRLVVKSKEIHL